MDKTKIERLMYIEALVLVNGGVKRSDLTERYRISLKTASLLINTYIQLCPEQMILQQGPSPHYVKIGSQPCLFKSVHSARKFLKLSAEIDEIVSAVDKL